VKLEENKVEASEAKGLHQEDLRATKTKQKKHGQIVRQLINY